MPQMKTWARNTSIILVLFATFVMVISLVLSEQLRVISNGLLLGGLFTMLYGVGWVIFSGNSTARFVVILFALVVTLGLGYVKFVRQRRDAAAEAARSRDRRRSTTPRSPGWPHGSRRSSRRPPPRPPPSAEMTPRSAHGDHAAKPEGWRGSCASASHRRR